MSENRPVLATEVTPPRRRFQNRGSLSILYRILVAAKEPVPRTHLMYKANLSFAMLNVYVGFATSHGLMEETAGKDASRKLFTTTKEGARFLEVYKSIIEIVPFLSGIDDF